MAEGPPRVWAWYVAYCWVAAGLHLAVLLLCVWVHFQAPELTRQLHQREIYVPDFFLSLAAGMFASSSIGFGAVCLWLPRVKPSRSAWSLHLSNLILGVLTFFLAPFLIPLLLAWLKPAVRKWFEAQG